MTRDATTRILKKRRRSDHGEGAEGPGSEDAGQKEKNEALEQGHKGDKEIGRAGAGRNRKGKGNYKGSQEGETDGGFSIEKDNGRLRSDSTEDKVVQSSLR